MMTKKNFDVLLDSNEIKLAQPIIDQAHKDDVKYIINVGTSLIESKNCIALAQHYNAIFAAVGIHPNDITQNWQSDIKELTKLIANKEKNKIIAIGECGIDRHYPGYNLAQQKDVFKAQIELALEHNLALIVHTRDARDETLRVLEEFVGQIKRGVIHCFSEDQSFANQVISWDFFIGIGGIITYPKNNYLRDIVKQVGTKHIILETDAPFLPPQVMRGKQNNPAQIKTIAEYIATLLDTQFETIAEQTYTNSIQLFKLP